MYVLLIFHIIGDIYGFSFNIGFISYVIQYVSPWLVLASMVPPRGWTIECMADMINFWQVCRLQFLNNKI